VTAPDGLGPPRGGPPASRAAAGRAVEGILLVAVAICVALMLVGLALAVTGDGDLPHEVVVLPAIPAGLVHGDPAAFLSLGLLVLLMTPVLRVAGALVVFALERDRRYVLVTAAVLAVMAFSVVLGRS
jgi:uncharacterized membrane protein